MSEVAERGEAKPDPVSQNEPDGLGEANDPSIKMSKDDIFYILRNPKRRVVLSQLLKMDGVKSLTDLMGHVALHEYGKNLGELTSDERKRIYTGLYQCHLPRMDEFGIVDFDKDANTVAPGKKASVIEPYLDKKDDASARVELAVALIVAPLVTLGVSGVGPLEAIPLVLWAGLTVCALLGLSLIGLYKHSR